MNRFIGRFAFCTLLAVAGAAQTKHTAATKPAFKAIWEPANYPQDADLRDVFFVSADVGWAAGEADSQAGEGGIILHTTDGGQHWDVQLGDPHSATRGFNNLFFLDAKHGWATQYGGFLVRTTDGETWEQMSKFPTLNAYTFVSPDVGLYVDGPMIVRTEDGGRNWKQVFACKEKVEVNGLTQDVQCRLHGISCPTPQICYAASRALPDNSAAIPTSEDGGLTWSISRHAPNASAVEYYGLFFADAQTGFMREPGKLWNTVDGGQSWRSIAGTFLLPLPRASTLRTAALAGWRTGRRLPTRPMAESVGTRLRCAFRAESGALACLLAIAVTWWDNMEWFTAIASCRPSTLRKACCRR